MLPAELIEAELELQFTHEKYTLKAETEITSLNDIEADAVFIATGKGGRDFGIDKCRLTDGTFYIAGGSLTGLDPIHAMASGLDIAWAVEVFLRTGKAEYPQTPVASRIQTECRPDGNSAPVVPADGSLFTAGEAAAEAKRCLRCQCNSCRLHCDLTAYLDKWPLQMRDDIFLSTKVGDSLVSKDPAKRLINTCSQCGLCSETCPSHIELDGMIKEARYLLHQQNKTPGGWHQFWLRDMEFSNGEFASLSIPAGKGGRAFFPGCWLGGADPDYVIKPYLWLRRHFPETGLLMRCCSIPADWAGNESLHEEEIRRLREEWQAIGSPELIAACPSCMKHLSDYLPEIPVISLYEVLAEHVQKPPAEAALKTSDKPEAALKSPDKTAAALQAPGKTGAASRLLDDAGFSRTTGTWAVFDPCQARHYGSMKSAVRTLASAAVDGTLVELPDDQGCCGFGGLGQIADSKFTDFTARRRISLSDAPYIVYCINCQEIFADRGKETRHILDILFDIKPGKPTETQRRENKIKVKESLLKTVLGKEMESMPEPNKYALIISPEMQSKMDMLKLLEADICFVLDAGEAFGRRTLDPETGHYKCYREIDNITCWVEYAREKDGIRIHNIYSHRMKIKLEEVWNGKKVETDLR